MSDSTRNVYTLNGCCWKNSWLWNVWNNEILGDYKFSLRSTSFPVLSCLLLPPYLHFPACLLRTWESLFGPVVFSSEQSLVVIQKNPALCLLQNAKETCFISSLTLILDGYEMKSSTARLGRMQLSSRGIWSQQLVIIPSFSLHHSKLYGFSNLV